VINLVRESPVILWNWGRRDISINITVEYLYGFYYYCRAKKECSVSITQKFSINVDGERGASMRELVARGVYPSLSSAFVLFVVSDDRVIVVAIGYLGRDVWARFPLQDDAS
jgi:hypothetical protein